MRHMSLPWKIGAFAALMSAISLPAACRIQEIPAPGQQPTVLPSRWTPTPQGLETLEATKVVPTAVPTTAFEDTLPPARSADFIPPPDSAEKGAEWVSAVDGKTMLFIPAGLSYLGAFDDYRYAEPDERPQVRVTLGSFWIQKTEVTNAEYGACIEAGACSPPLFNGSATRNEYFTDRSFATYPVINVNWYQARDYCAWMGGSLPSEAEWEKAARSPDGRRYPWEWVGSVYNSREEIRLNYCDAECTLPWADSSFSDGYADTAPVGSYPAGASPYGMLDMAGNVWEWTSAWYASRAYESIDPENPSEPEEGFEKVIRGGSWMDGLNRVVPLIFRSSNRAFRSPSEGYVDLGFRCVIPVGGS